MTAMTVAAKFARSDLTARWTDLLGDGLPHCRVVAVDAVPPEQVDILVVDNPDGSELLSFPNLSFVQSTWAGVDRLIYGGPAVPIARMVAPGLTRLMTEFVLTLVLMAHRDIVRYRRSQAAGQWQPLPIVPASQRTIGVLGYGELGKKVTRVLAGHGFPVTVWASHPREDEVTVLAGSEGWSEVLSGSQIVVNLLPLTPQTRGILDRRAFRLLGSDSTLINVGRGGHIVEGDLIEALDQGQLSDAILDVFVDEPLAADHPFWSHPRVTVLPHVAAPSIPEELVDPVCENIDRFVDGLQPRWLVSGVVSPGA